jgi:hypothetical protein
MIASRALRGPVALALGLVAAVAALAATPGAASAAGSTPQTLAFTTTPPTGSDWFFGDFHGAPGYVAHAAATSGLPVTYSVDAASAGTCRITGVLEDNPIYGPGAEIEFLDAGVCTIHADQAGDEEFAPAAQASQSFVIEKVQTWITASHATKGVLGLTPSTFSATLQVPQQMGPGWLTVGYPGQLVTFTVGGRRACSAYTGTDGVATCKAPIGLAAAVRESTYTAAYAGNASYRPSNAVGKLG